MVGRIRSEQMSQIPRDQNPLKVKDDLQFEFAFLFHNERGVCLIVVAYFASQTSPTLLWKIRLGFHDIKY